MSDIRVHLVKPQFSEKEKTLLEYGKLKASTFMYDTGVHAVRLKGERTELILLPFQGQQVWQANVDERNLTMKSMFDAPRPTQTYLETYGGFLIHCGVTAMGVPSEKDTHPVHGELPNAPYQKAYLVVGEDSKGRYLGLAGEYQHTVAFNHNYLAKPLVKVYEESNLFSVELKIENLKRTPMELMYLAHINFRPEDNAELIYSADANPESVRVRRSVPSHITPAAGYSDFLETLSQNPEQHHNLKPDLAFDPEVVFFVDYEADSEGWAHSLLKHIDGTSSYLRHKPEQLGYGVRWICRTPDQDAIGMVLPATAEPEGYTAEKAKGNIQTLAPKSQWQMKVEMGLLDKDETTKMKQHIAKTLAT